MINAQRVEAMLKDRYPDLERVGPGIFRGIDRFGSRDFAIRYFDLNDRLATTAESLKSYQEEILSPMYFSNKTATDLRWNHYLYFVTSDVEAQRSNFNYLKTKVEADREYARKQVLRESDMTNLLVNAQAPESSGALPIDLATTWSNTLEQQDLSFILDNDITVPDAVRGIISGTKRPASRPITSVSLLDAEKAASNSFIERLSIKGFRTHPEVKEHFLGRVNLIVGSNGVGKSSFLEAIEFAYCGKNRRESPILNNTSITLDLLGAKQKLYSTEDTARLRARHSNWYAKTDLRKISIHDSFGKFNFLDTDAAVELSVSASSEQIGTDVTRLVLGAAAEGLADRLRRVFKQLQEELKVLRRDREHYLLAKSTSQARIEEIKAAPKLSDSLFLELCSALSNYGWIGILDNKSQLEALRDQLQEATTATALVRQAPINLLQITSGVALQLLTNLTNDAYEAKSLDQRARAARLEEANARREAQAAVARQEALEALLPYARTDFPQIVKQGTELLDLARTRDLRLKVVADISETTSLQQFMTTPVEEAINTLEASLDTYQRQLDSARASIKALEKNQNAMSILKQRLVGTAQEILQRSGHTDQCPLCKTEFQEGQLYTRMMIDVEESTSEQINQLNADISSANDELENCNDVLALLRPLSTFIGECTTSISVADVFARIEQERTALEQEQYELEELRALVKRLRKEGLSLNDLSQKLLTAGMTDLPSVEKLLSLQSDHKKLLETLQDTEINAVNEAKIVRQECDTLAKKVSIEVFGDTDLLIKSLHEKIIVVEAGMKAQQILTSFITVSPEITAEEIVLNLTAAQQLVAQVTTAIAQENTQDTALTREHKNIEELLNKLDVTNGKIKRAERAELVLDDLTEQSSGGELANQILTENAEEIAKTFASIHMPNEFEIQAASGKLAIIRRSTGKQVQLNQMSTGQRAAFALSLFLAMNGRLQSGPPVILLDDPIAHIDDINMLSFLDHLRQLAITGSRQIFFATADTKLAGLFRHKFRFLGDEFKELHLSRTN
ncbi:AAA family ATPase [Shewanella sp. FJAT-52076]|uniref:AAA family ATPase n=1 Tax=Shewanella sp. FJAT-52076 TaxID=2864202 RepID=UPI001C65717E|nr:AAA family ATPase [Shewanella sp. FJAT-52076]QYJ75060.1 AAA family ATPase [Shewanella sp. FJAT-52076]